MPAASLNDEAREKRLLFSLCRQGTPNTRPDQDMIVQAMRVLLVLTKWREGKMKWKFVVTILENLHKAALAGRWDIGGAESLPLSELVEQSLSRRPQMLLWNGGSVPGARQSSLPVKLALAAVTQLRGLTRCPHFSQLFYRLIASIALFNPATFFVKIRSKIVCLPWPERGSEYSDRDSYSQLRGWCSSISYWCIYC